MLKCRDNNITNSRDSSVCLPTRSSLVYRSSVPVTTTQSSTMGTSILIVLDAPSTSCSARHPQVLRDASSIASVHHAVGARQSVVIGDCPQQGIAPRRLHAVLLHLGVFARQRRSGHRSPS